MLKRHKNNIKKYQAQQDWEKVYKEDVNVSRIITQLKELLYQMDTLRAQVLDVDIKQFDKLTARARTSILNAIKEYMELDLNIPTQTTGQKSQSGTNENLVSHDPLDNRYIQLQEEYEQLQRQQACLHSWNTLQNEIQQLHELFVEFNKIVEDQKELVNQVEEDVEETSINVVEGTKMLQKASRYKVAAYPLAGAVLGTCLGGPIGLLAGIKIGGLAALSCGLLGFTGGSLLKKKEIETHKTDDQIQSLAGDQTTIKKSTSLPGNFKEKKKEL